MNIVPEHIAENQQAAFNAAINLTDTFLTSIEKLTQLNIDAMRAVVENSSAIAHLLLESRSPEAALSGLTGRWQPEIERVDDYFRGVLEIAQEAAKCSLAR
ncbi:MAG: phasin family protein [Azonexus sp.]|nr:phasin family protein [Azonexus sp.]